MAFFDRTAAQLIPSPICLAEVLWLLGDPRDGRVLAAQNHLLNAVGQGVIEACPFLPEEYARSAELNQRYADSPADFSPGGAVGTACPAGVNRIHRHQLADGAATAPAAHLPRPRAPSGRGGGAGRAASAALAGGPDLPGGAAGCPRHPPRERARGRSAGRFAQRLHPSLTTAAPAEETAPPHSGLPPPTPAAPIAGDPPAGQPERPDH